MNKKYIKYMKNFLEKLEGLLKKDERFLSEDKSLLKNKVQELAYKNDEQLLDLLLSDDDIKNHFFINVKKTLIFDKEKFISFVSSKQFLPDSYTAFKNKIGLAVGDEYLSEKKEVVLNWPYKDCILEGGMTKEDQKRDEVFYNETLAPEEITKLLEPKAFINFKRIDKKGEHKLDGFNRDENGTIKDNLIIKGNNLLALASLKKEFVGKVKLIYIDPPFYFSKNKPEDTFLYNPNFKLSTWLTFIKNRLSIARDLLDKNGIIFVHVGSEDASYVNMLLDEVFKHENYINHISIKTTEPAGFKTAGNKILNTANHIFIYKKWVGDLNKIYIKKEYDTAYKYVLLNKEDSYSKWKYKTIKQYLIDENPNLEKKLIDKLIEEFALANPEIVFRTTAVTGGARKKRELVIKKSFENKGVVMRHPNEDVDYFYILNGEMISFWKNTYKNIDNEIVPASSLSDIWTDIGWTGISPEGGVKLNNGKKPEKLIKRVIELATKEGDIVLDYHLGSGTTCAVAHKMGRQYIGVEQMDYIETIAVERMKKVVEGEQGGISKSVNWRGGGDFVYMEMARLNQSWIDKINKAKNKKDAESIWEEIKNSSLLDYRVNSDLLDKSKKEFLDSNIDEQKRFLVECLDKNQLYVNLSEIKDDKNIMGVKNIELNKEFYSK